MKKKPRDFEYESFLNKELFKMSLLLSNLGTAKTKARGNKTFSVKASFGHGDPRERIAENLDYIRVCIKYLLLDNEAMRREAAGKK